MLSHPPRTGKGRGTKGTPAPVCTDTIPSVGQRQFYLMSAWTEEGAAEYFSPARISGQMNNEVEACPRSQSRKRCQVEHTGLLVSSVPFCREDALRTHKSEMSMKWGLTVACGNKCWTGRVFLLCLLGPEGALRPTRGTRSPRWPFLKANKVQRGTA